MTHFRFALTVTVLVLVGLAHACCGAIAQPGSSRPNWLFILTDDQSYSTIHALGNREISTPHLDQLVHRGLTFTHAFNQGAWQGAVCVASRTMLLTGRYLWGAAADYDQTAAKYSDQHLLWPQLLAKQGYRTYFSGKWHINAPVEQAFAVVRHLRPGMPEQTPAGYHRPPLAGSDPWLPWDPLRGGFWEGGKHWSEVTADDGINFLTETAQRTEPFFIYLAFNAPHDPRQSPREYVERYALESLSIPNNFLPAYPYDIGSNQIRDEQLAPFPRTEHAVRTHRREYYAAISHLDQQIGRVLEVLRATGQMESTIVCVTSDHGLAVGQHGLWGKQNLHDHSIRVPFIVAGPGIQAGTECSTPIYLQDIVPTSLELARAPLPRHIQFQSLLPWHQPARATRPIYGAYMQYQRMIRTEEAKLLLYPQIGQLRYYHLSTDPDEQHDLAQDPKYRSKIAELLQEFERLQGAMTDELDVTSIYANWGQPNRPSLTPSQR